MQIVLVSWMYVDWIPLDTILKLVQSTCWWLWCWYWLDMVDVAPLLSTIETGEYYHAFIYYCWNPVIKSVCGVKRTHMMVFYKYQLTYFEVRGLHYLSAVYGFGNPILWEQFCVQLPQLPELFHCYLPGLVTKVSTIFCKLLSLPSKGSLPCTR